MGTGYEHMIVCAADVNASMHECGVRNVCLCVTN